MDNLSELTEKLKEKVSTGELRGRPVDIPQKPTVCLPGCPYCGGVGLVSSNIADIHDPLFGKLVPCPNVSGERLYGKSSGLIHTDRVNEFDLTWSNVIDRENVAAGVSSIRECLSRGWGWVFLWGEYGLAKTLLEKIVVADAIRAKIPAAYCRMSEVINHLREAYDTDNPSLEAERRLSHWSDIDILCLDEVDRLKGTEFATEKRFVVMDRRYESAIREKSITIMASNSDPKTLEGSWSDRIFDGRFSVVHLTGVSMRPAMGR